MTRYIEVQSVLNKSKKGDHEFLSDYTFNPYSACAFNCLYCYIRGSRCVENPEGSFSIRQNTIEVLDRQLATRAKAGQYGIIVLSSATDPYAGIEKKYEQTRSALRVILKHRFPIHIITRGDLIIRDFDLLKEIDRVAILPDDLNELGRGAIVSFSFSTVQDREGGAFESGTTLPSTRLIALEESIKEGLLTGICMMPLLPYTSDASAPLHLAFSTFQSKKVDYVLPATMTLLSQNEPDYEILMMNAISKYYRESESEYMRLLIGDSETPLYCQKPFHHKVKELCHEYGLDDQILKAAKRRAIGGKNRKIYQ